MKLKSLLIVLAAFCCTSCSSIADNDSKDPKITGQWNWVQSTHGWTGEIILPDSAGYTEQLYFFADDTFSHFRADTLVKSGKYDIVENQNGDLIMSYEIEGQDYSLQQQVHFKTSNIIELYYLCIDCPTSIYERIK